MAHKAGKAPAIGIDLGTANSRVAVFLNGKVEIIPNDQGNRATPSYVAFTDAERLIGDFAKMRAIVNPDNTIFDSKRLIGRRFDDATVQADMKDWPFQVINDSGRPKVQITHNGKSKTFYPEEISSMVLTKMKKTAEAYLGMTIEAAVITVPSYFNDSQRQATIDSGTISGLHVIRLLNEPTAASMAYGPYKIGDSKQNVLMFDLGGGSVDVSILTIDRDDIFEVKSTAGDNHLGGEDFDKRMVNHYVEEFKREYNIDITLKEHKRVLRRLWASCESAKRTLSCCTEANIVIYSLFEGIDYHTTITRDQFEELNADLFRSIIEIVERALTDAEMDKSEIDEIVLVGGSTRIPKVQKLLQDFFNGKELNKSIKPDEAVAFGAAVQAAILHDDKSDELGELLLLDVTPLSLGRRAANGLMIPVIKRNTTIPAIQTYTLKTYYDNQTDFLIEVYEGEHTMAENNNLLGELKLIEIPRAPRGVSQIEVTFEVDINNILTVSAIVKSTNKETKLATIMHGKDRLSKEEIEKMVNDAKKYFAEDEKQRNNIYAKNNLKGYCINMKNTIEDDRCDEEITKVDKDAILEKCSEVILWLEDTKSADEVDYERKRKELKAIFDGAISKND